MFTFVRKRLDLKIALVMTLVIACLFGIDVALDIRSMGTDAMKTVERTLESYAAAVKSSVAVAMKTGRHADVEKLLKDAHTPSFVDRILIYDNLGRPIHQSERRQVSRPSPVLPRKTLRAAAVEDVVDDHVENGMHILSYYSSLGNKPECHRCHGKEAKINGVLRIDFPLQDIDTMISSRRANVLTWSLVLTGMVVLILVILLRTLIYRPMRELRDAMATVEAGADVPQLTMHGSDELNDLKQSFISMIDRMNVLHQASILREKEAAHNIENMRFRTELQAMFDAMPDGVLLIDPDMKIVHANPRIYVLMPLLDRVGGRIRPENDANTECPFRGIPEVFQRGAMLEYQCSFDMPHDRTRNLHSICAPVTENGRVAFVVCVIRDISERVSTAKELESKTKELMAANKKLSQLAITDSLTQVYNRHRFDEILAREIKRFSRRKYSALSLMMIDIDHFKQLNDHYGHLAGDAVLRDIARLLKEGARETDTVARFGGEEFVIVMPDTSLDGAAHKAEVIRNRVDTYEFPGQGTPLHVTISIGVASYSAGLPYDLVHAADLALYRAKHAGRNAVVASAGDATLT